MSGWKIIETINKEFQHKELGYAPYTHTHTHTHTHIYVVCVGMAPGNGIPTPVVLGASVRHSAHGKGHEEGGWTYTKAGSSLRSPPGNPQASTPITRACLLYYFAFSPTPLTLRGAVPHHLFRRRS